MGSPLSHSGLQDVDLGLDAPAQSTSPVLDDLLAAIADSVGHIGSPANDGADSAIDHIGNIVHKVANLVEQIHSNTSFRIYTIHLKIPTFTKSTTHQNSNLMGGGDKEM